MWNWLIIAGIAIMSVGLVIGWFEAGKRAARDSMKVTSKLLDENHQLRKRLLEYERDNSNH